MAKGKLATRRFALDAPYTWFSFAEPLAAQGAHVGRHFFRDFATENGAELTPASPHAGLVPAFHALRSDSFDPGDVDPFIVDFYEHTADFSMRVDGGFSPLFRRASSLFYRPLARWIEQLDVPDFQPGTAREMASQFGFIETDRGSPSRIWIRTMKDDGAVFYVGAVHDSIVETGREKHTYITMVFPLPRANLAVMLQLAALPGGGFHMTTNPRGATDAGTYLVVPGSTSVSWVEVPGADEHFTFRVVRRDGVSLIEGTHEAYWLGQRAFTLDYHIARSAGTGGLESFVAGSRRADGLRPIGALRAGVAGG